MLWPTRKANLWAYWQGAGTRMVPCSTIVSVDCQSSMVPQSSSSDQRWLIRQSFTHLPVEVHVAQLVGESLHVIWLQATGVVNDVVVCRRDAASVDGLAHNVEVVPWGPGSQPLGAELHRQTDAWSCSHSPLWSSDLGVDDGAGRRVGHLPTDAGEEPAADALLHHHHAQFGPGQSAKMQKAKFGFLTELFTVTGGAFCGSTVQSSVFECALCTISSNI